MPLTLLTLVIAGPVEMDAPRPEMPAPVLVGADARPVMAAPVRMPASESLIIGQSWDGQIGWVLTPRSQPVPFTYVVRIGDGLVQPLTTVRAAWPQAPAVRLVSQR